MTLLSSTTKCPHLGEIPNLPSSLRTHSKPSTRHGASRKPINHCPPALNGTNEAVAQTLLNEILNGGNVSEPNQHASERVTNDICGQWFSSADFVLAKASLALTS